jgi:hypothetical protein
MSTYQVAVNELVAPDLGKCGEEAALPRQAGNQGLDFRDPARRAVQQPACGSGTTVVQI